MQPATSSFYTKLEQTLQAFDYAAQVRELCAPAYSDSSRGRPGVDPAVYFKMLMFGFFENMASERGIAERCSDSISIRFFLGYDLTQATPDHSTLSLIRGQLSEDTYQQVFLLILSALQQQGLVKGRNVGIDTSVIEANAALKSMVNRDTQEAYWQYVRRLAGENGVNPQDAAAVRQFDRKRPKKMSNDDWENPHGFGGSIIRRVDKPSFEKAVGLLGTALETFRETVRQQFRAVAESNKVKLVELLLPALRIHPPDDCRQFAGGPDRDECLREWLAGELRDAFNKVSKVADDMRVTVRFKGVTYECLTNPEFIERAREAFPNLQLHEEFTAARETTVTEPQPKPEP